MPVCESDRIAGAGVSRDASRRAAGGVNQTTDSIRLGSANGGAAVEAGKWEGAKTSLLWPTSVQGFALLPDSSVMPPANLIRTGKAPATAGGEEAKSDELHQTSTGHCSGTLRHSEQMDLA
jgi:hypothetical protein